VLKKQARRIHKLLELDILHWCAEQKFTLLDLLFELSRQFVRV
jgi:hypothetical protein